MEAPLLQPGASGPGPVWNMTLSNYSDFTDRHDEYARMERGLDEAITYLEGIMEALRQ